MALATLSYWAAKLIEVGGTFVGVGLIMAAAVAHERFEERRHERRRAPLERAQARMAEIRIRTLARMQAAERRWTR